MSTFWERAKAGKGQVALLCGEPGIGQVPCHQDLVNSYRRRTAYRYSISLLSASHQQSILSHYQSARACGSFRLTCLCCGRIDDIGPAMAVARPDEGGLKPLRMEVEQSRKC